MTMTPRERLLAALEGGTPDRMPATIHHWQRYHLDKYADFTEPSARRIRHLL